ncbi:MAG: VIT1/CCC1 transporter family protein [Candidatus Pacearchaeota archaeon]|nr:VIT1/CCC1 transporter family protein [Candidatus Pacearchaeota archaeon]
MVKPNTKDFLRELKSKIRLDFEETTDYSKEYLKFKEESTLIPSRYEKACKNVGRIIKIKLKEKDAIALQEAIETAHLEIEPGEAAGLAIFSLLLGFIVSALICVAIFLFTNNLNNALLIFFLLMFVTLFLFYYLNTLPFRLAQKWRLKAASQMVPAILYIVIYMRHTSNLERAVRFAANNLQPPLALDFKKIFYDVETAKYATIKDALDAYLEKWRKYNPEFIEAMHLIESSLYEPVEERRIAILEKAMQVILDGMYEKMIHFTHEVKSPITNIYMLGIVLPTLGLALLPLASTLLQGAIKWYHVAILFNIILPFFVFYMTSQVLARRPAGYGETELLERNPNYKYYKDNTVYIKAFFFALPFLFIGMLPLLFHYTDLPHILGLERDYNISFLGQPAFDFKQDQETGKSVGPFGFFAVILGLFFTLGIAIFFSTAYKLKTQKLIKTREETKKLEQEFSSAIFQLGNRLADGIPAEMAFGRVANSIRGTATEGFFTIVSTNIQQLGMSLEQAIFNKTRGAINYYPSDLIRTSMQILVEAVKKGLGIAARAMMAISEYVKNIHKVSERLKDLLADIASSMKSNMNFLAPLLAAVVTGLAAMITLILSKLQILIETGELTATHELVGLGTVGAITSMFNVVKMIPPYWLQIIIGIYLIEIVLILTSTLVTIENGEDRLGEKYESSKNLLTAIILYFLAALVATALLGLLAIIAVGSIIV